MHIYLIKPENQMYSTNASKCFQILNILIFGGESDTSSAFEISANVIGSSAVCVKQKYKTTYNKMQSVSLVHIM